MYFRLWVRVMRSHARAVAAQVALAEASDAAEREALIARYDGAVRDLLNTLTVLDQDKQLSWIAVALAKTENRG